MAFHPTAVVVLLLALSLSGIEVSTSQILEGKVSCAGCPAHYDFSGIKVVVRCGNVKKLTTATTKSEGSFEVELPTGNSRTPLNCLARVVGGTSQIYATRKNMVSTIVKAKDSSSYTISTPLVFSTAIPEGKLKGAINESKTIDLPLPREWGFAPSSYYVPFFPIIGIP